MDSLLDEHSLFATKGGLYKVIENVDDSIKALEIAQRSCLIFSKDAFGTLRGAHRQVKQQSGATLDALKDVHKAFGEFSKAVDRKFKDRIITPDEQTTSSAQDKLVNRAIGMHFLREGEFAVSTALLGEIDGGEFIAPSTDDGGLTRQPDRSETDVLQERFTEMYYILHEMRSQRNLLPATAWSRAHSAALGARGSNLEFELARLHFIWLFFAGSDPIGGKDLATRQHIAFKYARTEFGLFQDRYLPEIQQLIGAMAFCPNLLQSPYRQIFYGEDAWSHLANSFTKEFCSLLGLSADSPIYVAATAGAIALPTLQKLRVIMETKRTEWTTQNELPVEIPLPPSYMFHSIFVCPVSKEQTTDQNPPMMMPCGHVVAQESLQRLSKVSRFKCPYCPGESHFKDARKVFL